MRQMSHVPAAHDRHEQSETGVKQYHRPGFHYDWNETEEDHQLRIGIHDREGRQYRAQGAGGSDHGGVVGMDEKQVADAGEDPAQKVKLQKGQRADLALDVAPEHVKSQHVEKQMREAAVQKLVGQVLAEEEILLEVRHVQGEDLLILRVVHEHLVADVVDVRDEKRQVQDLLANVLHDEDRDVNYEHPFHNGRQADQESAPRSRGFLIAVVVSVLQTH